MAKLIIQGGHKLEGEITVLGAKNAALPLLAATLLTDQPCSFNNVPDIGDIRVMCQILNNLGNSSQFQKNTSSLVIQKKHPTAIVDPLLAQKLRASILLLGPLVTQFTKICMPYPGGCILGRRPLGPHFRLLEAFGARVKPQVEYFEVCIPKKGLVGGRIFLEEASVTVTENALMIASTLPTQTTICNAAREPHVENLASMLHLMGAKITGAGTNTIVVQGTKKLHGCTIDVIPDQIEIATWAIAAALTQGELLIKNVLPEHLDSMLLKLAQAKVVYHLPKSSSSFNLHIPKQSKKKYQATSITTNLWPGFPTDLQAPFTVLMTQAQGISLIHDWMYEGRLFYVDKLISMGANITLCDPHRAIVYGPTQLQGKQLESPDLRAGMALVLAGLVASGTTMIEHIELVDRGYENIDTRLKSLGAIVERK